MHAASDIRAQSAPTNSHLELAQDMQSELKTTFSDEILRLFVAEAHTTAKGNSQRFVAVLRNLMTDKQTKVSSKEVLNSWLDKAASPEERAVIELRSWELLNYYFLDTETTGLEASDLPITWAICGLDGTPVLDIKISPVNGIFEVKFINPDAQRVHGITDAEAQGYPKLEDHCPYFSDEMKDVLKSGVFIGYNVRFDREMLIKAIRAASQRRPDDAYVKQLLNDFQKPERWLEIKPILLQAIGRDPESKEGRRTRLEDIARFAGVLSETEMQAHGALADVQLLARLRLKLIDRKVTTMAAAPKSETETKKSQPEILSHLEAKAVCYTNATINGIPVNITTREGATAQMVFDNIMAHLEALEMLHNDPRIERWGIVFNGYDKFSSRKGEPPPAQKQIEPPEDENQNVAESNSAKPKSNPRPPARQQPPRQSARPQRSGDQRQQGSRSGGRNSKPQPQEGDEAEKELAGITRVFNDKGQEQFLGTVILKNGDRGDDFKVWKDDDRDRLAQFLRTQGYEADEMEENDELAINFVAHWTYGGEIPNMRGARYRNNMWFEAVSDPTW